MTQREINQRIGARMKRAQEASGKNWRTIQEELGLGNSTLHRWWSGAQRPKDADLERYAKSVGVRREYFYMPDEVDVQLESQVYAILTRVADRIVAGESADEALSHSVEGELGTPEQQAILASATQGLREAIVNQAGGAWDRLTEREKLETVQRVVEQALAREP